MNLFLKFEAFSDNQSPKPAGSTVGLCRVNVFTSTGPLLLHLGRRFESDSNEDFATAKHRWQLLVKLGALIWTWIF